MTIGNPRAFLSCSFAEDDKSVIELFVRTISAFGFAPEVYDRQEVKGLTDAIKEGIQNSDCLIAIATRHSRIGDSQTWSPSEWIQQEVSFAKAFGKPIAIFVEEDVRLAGFLESERRQVFSRKSYTDIIDKHSRWAGTSWQEIRTLTALWISLASNLQECHCVDWQLSDRREPRSQLHR